MNTGISYEEVAAALEGQAEGISRTAGKGAPASARGELINIAAAIVRLKQIAVAIKGQGGGLLKLLAKVVGVDDNVPLVLLNL